MFQNQRHEIEIKIKQMDRWVDFLKENKWNTVKEREQKLTNKWCENGENKFKGIIYESKQNRDNLKWF